MHLFRSWYPYGLLIRYVQRFLCETPLAASWRWQNGINLPVSKTLEPYVAIATENTNFSQLAASTLQQRTGSNHIKICRKGFLTTTDENLVCLTSLYFNPDIPALRNCLVSSIILLPEAPQAIYLENGVYQLISRQPTMDLKNDSCTRRLNLSTFDCQACVLRPSCESTIYINKGDLVLTPDMAVRKTAPEPYIATIKLNKVF